MGNVQATPGTAGFTFNDPSAATLSAYTWATSPAARATSSSDCIVLIMNGNNPIVADVQSCNTDTTLPAKSYLCGRGAWA
ncbi:hypothetical protein GCK72_012737 [Caenorhabditis remanei]|uniref:C-type lectin domain-containing protein n=1 Tax=Caenorhabditis remanei TaxID=31234 RepID=A0A6A5GNR8_CAERE|nr:hypothetical protein GCK72_012737 [Caenorhabditis remanei]KAF1756284.1 hypothetical protein GCK72_012737 [Caenorhabditis remanei]